ncbi:MAG: heme exporter protein CcmB [Thermoplasmatota archaeon]
MSPLAALVAHDARIEARSREVLVATLLLGLLIAVVGLLALGGSADVGAVTAGVLWIGFAFIGSLGFARAFARELDRGTLDALLGLPIERGALYLARTLTNAGLVALVALVLAPAYLLLAGGAPPAVALATTGLVLALGIFGLAAAGTILAAIAGATRARDTLVPVLLFPVALPVLIAAVDATRAALGGASLGALAGELSLMLGYDIAVPAVSWLLFEQVVEG